MRAVDTDVLIRLVTRDDARQTAAAERFVANGAWVSPVTLAEAVRVLDSVYEVTPGRQAEMIAMLLEHRQLVLHYHDAVTRAVELFRAKPALGFSDCLMLEMARSAGHLPFGTFDRNLGKVEGAQTII